MTAAIEEYIHNFKLEFPAYHAEKLSGFSFGNTEEMADELSRLVAEGIKTGTSSMLDEYEFAHESIPAKNKLEIVLDGKNQPVCIIRNVAVDILPFNQITERQAFKEGEGDRSLSYWREVHEAYFSECCEKRGIEFTEDKLIVYEEFEVVYK
ncbi:MULTISPECIES: ASCH domain-containing protein [unclassified Enterococcus]|uniref:ASCH domain-containing protein n=1 Tax=unclassified Enterococcus TaxID=2608891 RepID=UPI0013EE030D|nr:MULTISPECIES: ASCH domain-containing protein [unclassified Enterococcus]